MSHTKVVKLASNDPNVCKSCVQVSLALVSSPHRADRRILLHCNNKPIGPLQRGFWFFPFPFFSALSASLCIDSPHNRQYDLD